VSSGNRFRQRTEDGAVAVETGILASVLVLLIFGALELADAWWTYNTMLLAIGEAGRYAMIYDNGLPPVCSAQKSVPRCPAPSDTPLANCAAARAQQILSMYRTARVSASVTEDVGSSPATATICASFSLGSLGTLFPDLPVNLTSRVTVPLI
jgi:TadE-like protein